MHEIRMVLGFNQRVLYLVMGVAFTALGGVTLAADGLPTSLFPGVVMVVMFFVTARWGTTLTPHGLVAKGFRTRHFAWHEIMHVEESSVLGTRTVRLTLVNGKRKRLRVPTTGWGVRDREFDAKLGTIWQWWAAATGRIPFPGQAGGPGQPWPQPTVAAPPAHQPWPHQQPSAQAAGQPPHGQPPYTQTPDAQPPFGPPGA